MTHATKLVVLGLSALTVGCDELVGIPGSITEDAGSGVHGDAGEAETPPGAAVAVSSAWGIESWCALTANGDVECWGDNSYGELGDGKMKASATPVKVILPEPATQVSLGLGSACALMKTGGVRCWGFGMLGQIGDGKSLRSEPTPMPVEGLDNGVLSVSVGGLYACAVKQDGSLWCWGAGSELLIHPGLFANDVPLQVVGFTASAVAVSVGGTSACAVLRGGRVMCWGGEASNGNGELGHGALNGSATPVPVMGLASGVRSVSVGAGFACALTDAGAVECWGDGSRGTLGDGQFATSPIPVLVLGLSSGVIAVSAGEFGACALKRDNTVWCWGSGAYGDLGDGPWEEAGVAGYAVGVPVQVKGILGAATAISSGGAPCAVTTRGGVECWGLTGALPPSPVPVSGFNGPAVALSIGGNSPDLQSFACGLSSQSAVECWGANGDGQLGNGTSARSSFPVGTTGFKSGATGISAGVGGSFACGIVGGLVQCWGDNSSGQLGNGTTRSISTPVTVRGLPATATAVSAGSKSACALTAGGAVSCWGDNSLGQLGTGTTTSSDVAVSVSGLKSGVTAISVGFDFACALQVGGVVVCWGDNALGQLGNGTLDTKLIPTPVPGLATATSISAGWLSTCVVTSAQSVVCWGNNDYDQLGALLGHLGPSLLPTSSALTGNASKVAVGWDSACAIVNGGVYCWGSGVDTAICKGFYGGCGDVMPAPVAGLTSGVTDIAVGYDSKCAIVDGAIKCWGINTVGQLGNGGALNDLVATPVPGFP